ncbi:MAG: formate dehydrogenase, partial [Proteobacteria bacterium]|nr:formate dehydrogenase [Pseudomonadota bacterium]
LPSYLALPNEKQPDLKAYLAANTPKMLAPGQVNYWSNYPKFMVSLLKTLYGDKATADNDFGYNWLPKMDKLYDTMHVMDLMENGKVNGFIAQGYNVVACMPNKHKSVRALSKLKFMVVIDPLDCETANFWQNDGEYNDVDPSKIQTEVFNLPSSCFAEEEGSITNSGRWLQWHWKGADPPGEGKSDAAIIAELMMTLRELYEKEGGPGKESFLNMSWNYSQPRDPAASEIAKELNGKALADLNDAEGKPILKKGQQLASFAQLKDDGSTASGCWIYAGCWTEAGNQMARRDNADPSGLGNHLGWAWAWPLNRRILYNRASLDRNGKPWDKKRKIIGWQGDKWGGFDIPDFTAAPPGSPVNPFIMQADGVGSIFALGKMAEGPLPEHYEPMESPIGVNPLHEKVISSPAVRVFANDAHFGAADKFPYVGTTYRLTEHFHTITKSAVLNAVTQPEAFAEISETLAKKIGVKAGDTVKVSSLRGYVIVKAVVTKRVKALEVDGKTVEIVGLPIHWGQKGVARKAMLTNVLTPSVGDANSQTPEFKAFLVNIEKV